MRVDPVPDPAYHFDAVPDFYLLRMRIQVYQMMRIHNTGATAARWVRIHTSLKNYKWEWPPHSSP
jgi:hypothetical protein